VSGWKSEATVDSTTQFLTIVILTLTVVSSLIVTQFIRRRPNLYTLRDIPAYQTVPMMIGEAVEANRPVHVSLGNAGLGGNSTILALASAELFYQIVNRAAIGGAAPIITVSDTSAVPLGQDTLRRAYAVRGIIERYPQGSVRWYPGGGRSLAFAAALTATLGDDHVSSSFLAGSFGVELALVAEAAARRNQGIIATSDQLEGQAVAYAMSDQVLIGEEVFAAGGYLGGAPSQIASIVTLEMLRLLLILALIIPAAVAVGDTVLNGRFSLAIGRLISILQGGG
jgi:uncharacterized protein DUF6754